MSAPPYMKLYVADYLGDTHHLSVVEHGAYLLLLMAMWRSGGSLPAADANLSKLARCSPEQWGAVRDAVLPMFKRSRGRITQKRLAAEIAKYETISGKRSEAGKQGAAEKARKIKAAAPASASDAESNCTHNQNHNQKDYIADIDASAPDWSARLDEATTAGGEGLDRTSTGLMHARDLRALCEPSTGEPCEWGEVLDAVRMSAARAKTRGKPLRSWSWVRDDALALRDKRLTAHLPKPEHRHERPSPSDKFDRRQANHAASDAGAFAAARQRFQP